MKDWIIRMSTAKMEEPELEKKLTELLELKLMKWESVQKRIKEVSFLGKKLESLKKRTKFRDFQKMIRALNNSSRLEILFLINNGITCLCELEFLTKFAQATISHHISILEDAGLILRTRKGKWSLLSPINQKFFETSIYVIFTILFNN